MNDLKPISEIQEAVLDKSLGRIRSSVLTGKGSLSSLNDTPRSSMRRPGIKPRSFPRRDARSSVATIRTTREGRS